MGRGGPPKKPTRLKALEGFPGKQKLNRGEPVPVGELDGPATELTADQQRLWDFIQDHAPDRLFTPMDRAILTVWVSLEATFYGAKKRFDASGGEVMIKSPKTGQPIVNPYWKEMRKTVADLRTLSRELGFTPAARAAIVLDNPDAGDEDFKKLIGAA